VLSDTGNATANLYGLAWTLPDVMRGMYEGWGIDLPAFNGEDSWRLPMPARYVVDQDRTIRYARVDPDYMIRPEPRETLEFVRELVG
jgi:peroxiredoxin